MYFLEQKRNQYTNLSNNMTGVFSQEIPSI